MKPTILFFTQNLQIGGVQKSVTTLANFLVPFYTIHIVLAEKEKSIEYTLSKKISLHSLQTLQVDITEVNVGKKIFNHRVKALDTLLHKLNINLLISYEDYNNIIALNTTFICKKIVSSRVILSDSYTNESYIHLLDAKFYYDNIRKLYPKSDLVICVSQAILKELSECYDTNNLITIYNGIITPKVTKPLKLRKKFILHVGRLHPQKGQKDLILAYNKIKNFIEEDLILLGEGVSQNELKTLISSLNLQNRIHLLGFKDPYPYIQACSMFVFPSYYEGFSNSVLEVMSMKKAILSYKYKGAQEIFTNEMLIDVGDIDKLSSKMLSCINDKQKRVSLENSGYTTSKKFTLDNTLNTFYTHINKVLLSTKKG